MIEFIQIMTQGLWRFTRHPNYSGETALWWGIYVIALSVKAGWTAVASPLLITFLLLNASDIPMLEKKYRGKKFEEYAQRTSAFFSLVSEEPVNSL